MTDRNSITFVAGALATLVAGLWILDNASILVCGLRDWLQRRRADSRRNGIQDGLVGLIGNTPLVRITQLSNLTGCEILAKAENSNPGGSPKDRVALEIIREAERSGKLVPGRGDVICEGTAGSTGISLAMLSCALKYSAHIFLSTDQSIEKVHQLEALDAKVTRVPPAPIQDPKHFVNRARAHAAEINASTDTKFSSIFADQFESDANWRAHYNTTGPEIYEQSNGHIDAFVAGAGTGGTIAGVSLYLKERLPNLKVYLADPQGSGLFNKVNYGVMFDETEKEGTRRRSQVDSIVEGVGINRITHNFEVGRSLLDQAIKVNDQKVINMSRFLVEEEGLFVGSSSCLNLYAAALVGKELPPGSKIVTVLGDSGHRHLSKLYNEEFLKSLNLKADAQQIYRDFSRPAREG